MNLIELHILQSFPVTCLNRDDVGAPKTAIFGGCQRARVSSQCWKRAIRSLAAETDVTHFSGKRTRYIVEPLESALQKAGKTKEHAQIITEFLADGIGKLDTSKKNVKTLLYFSPMELQNVVDEILEQDIDKYVNSIAERRAKLAEGKKDKTDKNDTELSKITKKAAKNLSKNVKDAADIAIFGRMVADDHSLMVEGAGLFSHALSTHKVSNEIDFFSAVDDTDQAVEGAGHIGTIEFNSACYYRYVGLNLDLLKDEGHLAHFSNEEREAVIQVLLKSALLAVPSARKNSMFGFNPPAHVFGLKREGQPLSLVNAFEKPIMSSQGYVEDSYKAMKEHWQKLSTTYGLEVSAEAEMPNVAIGDLISTLTKGC